jgi:hypothetical protein
MNTQEQIQRGLGALLIIVGAAFRIFHFSNSNDGRTLMTFGFIISLVAYQGYSRRLKVENKALRHQLPTTN